MPHRTQARRSQLSFIRVVAGETIQAGSLVFITASGQVQKGDQTNPAKVRIIGATIDKDVLTGERVEVQKDDVADVRMLGGLVLTAGDTIWLATDGRGTNVMPVSGADVVIGKVLDPLGYNPMDVNPKVTAVLKIQDPVFLA